jgi:hypothetical protein
LIYDGFGVSDNLGFVVNIKGGSYVFVKIKGLLEKLIRGSYVFT